MNTVSSLLTRLGLEKYITHFDAAHVESIGALRGLTHIELLNYVTDSQDCSKLILALNEACAPVPGSAEAGARNPSNKYKGADEYGNRHSSRVGNNDGDYNYKRQPREHTRNHDNPEGDNRAQFRGGRGYPSWRGRGRASAGETGYHGQYRGANTHRGGNWQNRSYGSTESRTHEQHNYSQASSHSSHYPTAPRNRIMQERADYHANGHSDARSAGQDTAKQGGDAAVPERLPGICRDYNSPNGCRFGEGCRYRHILRAPPQSTSAVQENGQGAGSDWNGKERPPREFVRAPGTFETTIQILTERMKLLLALNAKKLREIHYRHGTSNKRVDKFEECEVTVNFTLYGTQEGIEGARKDIEHFVGIEKRRDEEARFQYYINEHTRNQEALNLIAAFNKDKQGTEWEISQDSFQRISQYLLLTDPFAEVKQRFINCESHERHRKQHMTSLLNGMQGNIQVIVFGSWKSVNNLQTYFLSHGDTRSYGGAVPVFLCPPNGSAETVAEKKLRLRNMEIFKRGTIVETSKGKVLQRLLICTDDYARYARRHAIPYINQIIHFNMPRTKLNYVYRLLTLSRRKGSSLLICTERESELVLSLNTAVTDMQHLPTENLYPYGKELVDYLDWETVECPRTDFANVEPKSENWEAELDEKVAAKEKTKTTGVGGLKEKMVSEIDAMDE